MYFSDKLLQALDTVKNICYEFDGKNFSVGLPGALDHLAERSLAQHNAKLVVLLNYIPEERFVVIIFLLFFLHSLSKFKIIIKSL